MKLAFTVAEARMNELSPQLEPVVAGNNRRYEQVELRAPFGIGDDMHVRREVRPDGTRGPIVIDTHFTSFLGTFSRNVILRQGDDGKLKEDTPERDRPGLRRQAGLLTKLLFGRPASVDDKMGIDDHCENDIDA